MRRIGAILVALAGVVGVRAESLGVITGSWNGAIEVSAVNSLKIGLNIADDGGSATLDSPQQGAIGLEAAVEYNQGDSVAVALPQLGATLNLKRNGDSLVGRIFQGDASMRLTMTKGAIKLNRPQTPIAPFPYKTEEVTIANGEVSLSGTLTLPQDASRKTPVVVMVTGSGLQNRDEEIFQHRPFAVIADHLARNGIATLRCDDCGVGKSTGDVQNATTADFAADAKVQIQYLKKSKRFGKIGVLGHSEGGSVAFMLGEQRLTDFIVLVAGPTVRGDSVLIDQNEKLLSQMGLSEKAVSDYATALTTIYNDINRGVSYLIPAAYVATLTMNWDKTPHHQALAANLPKLIEEAKKPWLKHFVTWSPDAAINATTCPVLALYGSKDVQVDAAMNSAKLARVKPSAMVKTLDGLNHLMQHATTGSPMEYGQIEETFAPEALAAITAFIQGL